MTPSTDTELDRQIDALFFYHDEHCPARLGKYECSCLVSETKAQLKQLIARERLDEMKLATVGRVISKNKKSLTYMSGFGYAANNLQEHKNTRLAVLQAQADKGEQDE